MNCKCIPTYNVKSIAIDSSTGIATMTVDATTLSAGCFNLVFNLCCQKISSCASSTIQLKVGSSTFVYVLRKDGNYATLGQCARQINCCHILHCNLTSAPAGNIIILDKLPACTAKSVTGTTTVVTTD